MISGIPAYDPQAAIIAIEIGNTNIGIATWHDDKIKTPLSVPTVDPSAFHQAYDAHLDALPTKRLGATIVGSVVPGALDNVRAYVEKKQDKKALVIGESLERPIDVGVTDKKAIGIDRVCAAAAAYETLKTGCTVIDFGTAVTVDLVDDEGVLVGGAILPGLWAQFRALHEHTAQLPLVEPSATNLPYGRNTTEAIQAGVCRGLAGAVRALVEGYATSLNRWPQVVATGGDVAFMTPLCDFLDTAVEHLTLRGIALAYLKHMGAVGG